MFNTSIVEVAIGLIFVFSLLAIMVTQINTFIQNALNLRAKQLKEGLQDLVTDKELQARLLAHPLINMVQTTVQPTQNLTRMDAEEVVNTTESKVTYIDPKTFVDALIDLLATEIEKHYNVMQNAADDIPSSDEKSKIRELIRALRSGFSEQTIRELRSAFKVVADEEARARLLKGLEDLEETLDKLNFKGDQLVPLLEGVRSITDGSLRTALQTLLTSAQTLDEARTKLESWFNDAMGRVSVLFKRRMVYYSLLVAFLLSVILNVDTLTLARALWENPELRQALVQEASEALENQAAAAAADSLIPEATAEVPGTEVPGTAVPGTETATAPVPEEAPEGTPEETTLADVIESAEAVNVTVQQLLELQLPIGWEYTVITDEIVQASQQLALPNPRQNARNLWNFVPGNLSTGEWLSLWLRKIVGILVTTIAAAQGAPFWFDLLNRIARPR